MAIAEDAQARIAIMTSPMLGLAKTLAGFAPRLGQMQWIAADVLPGGAEEQWREPDISPTDSAFLQYTSGSTRAPKGVILSHENLIHNSQMIQQAFEAQPQDSSVIWLPPYHNMGLIGGILQPLYTGSSSILMSPLAFLQRPIRWLQAISRYKATASGGPNFAFDLCVQRIPAEQRETLDLSSWNLAFSGAEPVRPETIQRFSRAFAPCGFRQEAFFPCYGLAEGTFNGHGRQEGQRAGATLDKPAGARLPSSSSRKMRAATWLRR